MLYKPNFCCNCGEKIERANWSLFTSRRFCGVCETEFKGVDYLPRVAVLAAMLVIVVGAASYLRKDRMVPPSSGVDVSSRFSAPAVKPESNSKPDLPEPATANAAQAIPQTPERSSVALPATNSLQRQTTQKPSTETAYYCGALTKKGTPCTRRVRSNGVRCFQHQGQPSAADLR